MPAGRIDRRYLLWLVGSAATTTIAGCTQWTEGTAQTTAGTIEVTPGDALVDEPLEIVLSGFDPNEELVVWARTDDEQEQTWLSFGRYETNDDGTLALTEQAPLSGTYEGIDPNGLLWSMQVPDGVTVPFIQGETYEIEVVVQRNDTSVVSTDITRRFIDPGVVQHRITEEGIVGMFFEPSESGPHPGMLALHGSEGELPWLDGAMLASHGYATLALQYFSPTGDGGLPEELVGIPLEYGERAIEWLLEHPSVIDDQIGVMGGSKGGELALLLGSTFSQIGAVIGSVPSGVVWQGLSFEGTAGSSWSYEGENIPFVPIEFDATIETVDATIAGVRGRPVPLAGSYRAPLESPESSRVAEATIPVEQIDGPVLLISGKDDALWPSTGLSELAMRRLNAHDHTYPYEHLAYEDAGHFISVPYQPTSHFDAFEFMPGFTMKLGGTPAGNAHAAADSWPRILEFLDEGLR